MTDQLRKAAQNALDWLVWFYDKKNAKAPECNEFQVEEQLREALAEPVQSGWLRAVDEAMVCSHLGIADAADDYDTAKKKLNDLICWNIDVDRYFEADKRKQSGWIGLTDDERVQAFKDAGLDLAYMNYDADKKISKVIEAALKAKNAAHQERVPMTEDEMRDLLIAGISLSERGMFKLIREVESHHGIKEQK